MPRAAGVERPQEQHQGLKEDTTATTKQQVTFQSSHSSAVLEPTTLGDVFQRHCAATVREFSPTSFIV